MRTQYSMEPEMTDRPLTGRKVFLIVASAFAVIIGVNITLAVKAVSTFPGLETKNSYVASQEFDSQKAEQLALGWEVSAVVADGILRVSIRDQNGDPVEPKMVGGVFGRATHTENDQEPLFAFDGQDFVAPVKAAPGNWNMRLTAIAEDGTEFHQRIVLYLKG